MKSLKESYKYNINEHLHLDMLFDFCPDGIVFKDKNLRYLSVNKGYCELFSVPSLLHLTGCDENLYLSEKNKKLIKDADLSIKNGLYFKNYILNISSEKIVSVTSFPVVEENEFAGLISIVRDITQEEILKEKFVNKHYEHINNEKLLQEQRETFVASIGHDLKNPTLAQIRGLELLLKGEFGKFNDEQKELLEMILDSCRYMNGMLSTLLETYRNYDGQIKLNYSDFCFSELVKECVSEMIYIAKDKGVKIVINSEENELFINADRVQIKRVIMNLLSNGIKYAFKNTDLKLYFWVDKGILNFKFENESPFIPVEKQKTIFARYVSYASKHKELGIGLGLYASKKIINLHGGNIYVKSSSDDRNCFGFNIPRYPEP